MDSRIYGGSGDDFARRGIGHTDQIAKLGKGDDVIG